MAVITGFLAGLQAWDNEKRKAEAKKLKAERAAMENYVPPKGMYTGNTPAEVESGTLAVDNPTYVKVHAAEGTDENWRKQFYKRVAAVESPVKGYTALNKKTGAYGKYQFIPKTAKWVAGELGFEGDEWKKPENQEKMMDWMTNYDIKGLKKRGIPVSEETLWWAHNQGLGGANALYKGGKVKQANLVANAGKDEESYKKAWSGKFSDALIENTKQRAKQVVSDIGTYEGYEGLTEEEIEYAGFTPEEIKWIKDDTDMRLAEQVDP